MKPTCSEAKATTRLTPPGLGRISDRCARKGAGVSKMLNVTLVLLAALFVALAVAVAAEAAVYGGVRERQCDATGHCVEVAIAVETNGASIRAVGNVRCLSASETYAYPAV